MVNTRGGAETSATGAARGAPPPPPDLATLVTQQAQLIQLLAQDRQDHRDEGRRGGSPPRDHSYPDFEALRPPVFTTARDPLDADDWLRTIESKFGLLPHLTEQQKAQFAAQLLQGAAGAWWASFVAMQPTGHQVTWVELRHAFRAHYIPASLMELKQREFRALRLGNKTVLEYIQTFIHLS